MCEPWVRMFPIFVNPMERDTEPQLVFAWEQFHVFSCLLLSLWGQVWYAGWCGTQLSSLIEYLLPILISHRNIYIALMEKMALETNFLSSNQITIFNISFFYLQPLRKVAEFKISGMYMNLYNTGPDRSY